MWQKPTAKSPSPQDIMQEKLNAYKAFHYIQPSMLLGVKNAFSCVFTT